MSQNESTAVIRPDDEANPLAILNELVNALIHRRWLSLGTASLVILASISVMLRVPNRYTSEATIVVTQQRIPERYVVPTSTTDLTKDLETMQGEVLSRTRLLGLIDEFGLYPKERRRLAPEQLLDLIRSYITVEPLAPAPDKKEADSFKVSFTAENPVVAQQVTDRLASLFILNNVKGREDQAVSTTKFLHDQMDDAQKKLSSLEESLRDFKMQHLGELPEQQQGNLAILGGLQTQLQNTTSAIARAEQQRVYMESLLSTLRARALRRDPGLPAPPQVNAKDAEPGDPGFLGAELRLAYLRNERKTLSKLRPPNDPDIVKTDEYIAKTEALLEKLKVDKPQAEREAESEDTSVAQLESQQEANRLEIQNLKKDEAQLKESIAQYQNRLNETPVREQQLAGLSRDIDLEKQQYSDLLTKEQQSQLATTLEKQQGGQQFRLLEPASLPTLPSSPKRMKLGLGAGAAGIALGLLAAFLMEFRNRSFYGEKDLSEHCALPLVVGVPLFITPAEQRKRSRTHVYEWIGGVALALVVCGAEVVYLRGWDIVGHATYFVHSIL